MSDDKFLKPGELAKMDADDAERADKAKALSRGEARRMAALRVLEDREQAAFDHAQANGYTVMGGETNSEDEKHSFKITQKIPDAPIVFVQPPHKGKGNPITTEEMHMFLSHVARSGNWNQSAYLMGRDGRQFRELAKTDPFFSVLVQEAVQDFKESIFAEVHHRAIHGWMEPVFAGKEGDLVGHIVKKSDRLLELLIKAVDKRFQQSAAGVNVNVNTDVKFGVAVVPGVSPSREDWEAERDAIDRQRALEGPPMRTIKRRDKDT